MVRATSSSNKPKTGLIEYLRSIASRGKHNQPLQKHALEERLDYRDSLVEKLAGKKAEASQFADQLRRQRSELLSARNVVEGLSLRVSHEESGISGFRGADSKHQLDEAQAELNRLIASVEADDERFDSLSGEIESLQREIQSISQGAAADDVKVYLSTLNEQRAQVAHLEELIRDLEANSAPNSIDADELIALQEAHRQALAGLENEGLSPAALLMKAVDAVFELFGARPLSELGREWIGGLAGGIAERFEQMVGWLKQKVSALSGWLPDWMTGGGGLSQRVGIPATGAAAAPKLGAPVMGNRPSPLAAGSVRADVGGELRIKIDAEGRPRVASMKANGGLDYRVESGLLGVVQ